MLRFILRVIKAFHPPLRRHLPIIILVPNSLRPDFLYNYFIGHIPDGFRALKLCEDGASSPRLTPRRVDVQFCAIGA